MIVATSNEALTPLSEGIALLIDLAKQGEIDPWDVQVIDVIDRYLSQLSPDHSSSPGKNFSDLSQSGQAFLYASMLVLLKADSLTATEADESDDLQPDEELLDLDSLANTPLRPQNLERQLRRRAVPKVPQKRRVTLPELIQQLQLMTEVMADQKNRPRRRRSTSKAKAEAARTIAELAHQENLTETATKLEQLLIERWPEFKTDWLDLEQLLGLWSNLIATETLEESLPEAENSHKSPHHDRVGVFWALLLLSAQSKVELTQEEFYKDIKIRTLSSTVE